MTQDLVTNSAVPPVVRHAAEEVVVEAEDAAHDLFMGLQQAIATFEREATVALADVTDVGRASIQCADETIAVTFDFTSKLLRATTLDEVMRIQFEFIKTQREVMLGQMQKLGSTAARGAIEIARS